MSDSFGTSRNSYSSKSYSFVILDLNNKINISELCDFLNQNYSDYEVLYCTSKPTNNYLNVINYNFAENEDSEKIINSVIKFCEKNNIIVIREYTTCEDIKRQTNALVLTNQIVYFNKEMSNFKKFFYNILLKLINLLFLKDFILTNSCCVSYGEIASNILKKLEYPSNLMRINGWQGIQLVGVDGGKSFKFNYNKTKSALLTLVPLFFSILLVILFIVLKNKMSTMVKIFIWLTIFISIVLSSVFGINWFIKNEIGENILEKAKIKGE